VFFVSSWDNYYHQIGHTAKSKTAFKPLPHCLLFIKLKKWMSAYVHLYPLMTTFFHEKILLLIEKEQP